MCDDVQSHLRSGGVLATDLDGTFIPLADDRQNKEDLQILSNGLCRHDVTLAFVTGRHLALVEQAIEQHGLPDPDWVICDVGSTICERASDGQLLEVAAYRDHLDTLVESLPLNELRDHLRDLTALELQESEKQGRFKLSYYVDASQVDAIAAEIGARLARRRYPYSMIHSVDPFTGKGLIDLLPREVSKAYALRWWTRHSGRSDESFVFAGDSGNDLAAFVAGYRTIVVGNADRQLARQIYDEHRRRGWCNRLYLARTPATSGVLEGSRWFGLLEPQDDDRLHPMPGGPVEVRPPSAARLGTIPVGCHRTQFRVWAPRHRAVAVAIHGDAPVATHPLQAEAGGYFSGMVTGVGPGDRYQFVLDEHLTRPDPRSRYQPDGVHGDSQIIDPGAFPWRDRHWQGIAKDQLIIYELHLGAFTEDGTLAAAARRLSELQELGITAVEIMPVAQTPGRWNWGYDGVNLFAVRNSYGTPDDFKSFVDECHMRGLAVILDVVYNHVGPEGNYLADFGPYFSSRHHTPWGDAFDYDGPDSEPARRYVVDNALCWLDEYHLDGLRLDAVHFMLDDRADTILDEIRTAVTDYQSEAGRQIHLIAEANVYDSSLLESAAPHKSPYDAIWCDDIMHSIYSVVTHGVCNTNREYRGVVDLVDSLKHGYVYTGPKIRRARQRGPRPVPEGHDLTYLGSLVVALQTHDVVGNDPRGRRLHQLASTEVQKAAASLVLLYPAIPLLFMGEERASDSPFRFFVDFEDKALRRMVDEGRAREYPQHLGKEFVSPVDERAFFDSKCTGEGDHSMREWYQSLISLRKKWRDRGWLDPSYLTVECDPLTAIYMLRYDPPDGERLFVVARIQAPGDAPPYGELQIHGDLLLDSHHRQPYHGNQRVVFQSARAVIGRGDCVSV